jgi:hypothetical protein
MWPRVRKAACMDEQKITVGEMRASGVRVLLAY